MTTASSRSLWKGAISFGLVHIPVALHAATVEGGLNFDWLDKRTMDPVGYRRINKKTGKEIDKENIVKGIEYEDGKYVVLSQEEIAAAYPKTTQTIEIETFVPATAIPFTYLERPYYIVQSTREARSTRSCGKRCSTPSALALREWSSRPSSILPRWCHRVPALILNTFALDRPDPHLENLSFPAEGTEEAGITEKELKMAEQLVTDMSGKWQPEQFQDSFKDEIMKLVNQKVETGDIQSVVQLEEGESPRGAQILDLTELLQRSLKSKESEGGQKRTPGKSRAKPRSGNAADAESGGHGSHKRRA